MVGKIPTQSRQRGAARAPLAMLVFAAAGALSASGGAIAAYGTDGGLKVSVIGDQIIRGASDALSVSDSATVVNASESSTAAVAYSASLATARVTTSAAAAASPADVYDATAFVEADPASFSDRLTFVMPAGTYETGAHATFRGFAGGALSSVGCTNHNPDPGINLCSNGFQTITFAAGSSLGNATYHRRLDVNAGAQAADGLAERFSLTVPLVQAGQVFASPTAVSVVVSGSMSTRGTAVNTYSYPFGAKGTQFTSDFSAYFSGISVQPGIVWEPESDVFLSQPVPEPETWALLVGGGALLAARVLRCRKASPPVRRRSEHSGTG